jgi:hypothetical protein
MDPITVTSGILGILAALITVGNGAWVLKDGFSQARRELEAFRNELAALETTWNALKRSIDLHRLYLTADLLSDVGRITADTKSLLENLQTSLRELYRTEKQIQRSESWRKPFAVFGALKKVGDKKDHRIRTFLKRSRVKLMREQVLHSTNGLNILATTVL